MVEFLVTRYDEGLEHASCDYDAMPDGHLLCRCERPHWETLEMVACLELVHRWSDEPDRKLLLRMLADDFSGHRDYERQWHVSDL